MNVKRKSVLLELFTWVISSYKIYNLKNWHTGNFNLLPWSSKTQRITKKTRDLTSSQRCYWGLKSSRILLCADWCMVPYFSYVLIVFMFRVNKSLYLQMLNALWDKLTRISSNGQFLFLEDRQTELWDLHCCLLQTPENWTINYATVLLSYSPSINRPLNSLISTKTLILPEAKVVQGNLCAE